MYPGQFKVRTCIHSNTLLRTEWHLYGFLRVEFDSGMILENFALKLRRRKDKSQKKKKTKKQKTSMRCSRHMEFHLKICDHERQAS